MSANTNQVLNPDNSGATLSIENGTGTTVTRLDMGGGKFSAQCQATSTAIATARLKLAQRAAALAGQSWFVILKVRASVSNGGARDARVRANVFNVAPGATLGTVTAFEEQVMSLAPGQAATLGVQILIPSGAVAGSTSIGFELSRLATSGAASGDYLFIDEAYVIQTDTLPTLLATPNTSGVWYWNGDANNSTSYYPVTTPALTKYETMDPCPRVRVEFGAFLPDTDRITLYQIVQGDINPVAGAEDVEATPAGIIRTDYFPPFGVAVSYQAEMFDALGVSLGVTDAASVTVDFVGTVISSPVDPRKSVVVDLDGDAGSVLAEEFRGAVHQIGERRILIASGGTGIDKLNMDFWTDTIEQYRMAVQALKDAKGLIVLRTSYPIELPPVLFVWIPRSERMQTNLPAGIEEFKFENEAQQVSPPSARVIFSPINYGLFKNFYSTYRKFRQAYATYRAALLNPPPEV